MRALWLTVVFALVRCADFSDAELEYCAEHPGVCPVRDAGSPDSGAAPDGGP